MDLAISALALVTAVTAFVQYRRMRRILLTAIDRGIQTEKSQAKAYGQLLEECQRLRAELRDSQRRLYSMEERLLDRVLDPQHLGDQQGQQQAGQQDHMVEKTPDYEPEGALSVWHRLRREAEDL